jgi:sirohydrochlorin ferrochelatase
MTAPHAHVTRPALLAVAHGSRDPRHAASLRGLLAAVCRARPGLRAELGFLDLCGPDVPTALARLVAAAHEDTRRVVVLPLFLSHGYHVGHDIPAVTAQARRVLRRPPALLVADPLGPDPLLDAAMRRRLGEQGPDYADSDLDVVVASATIAPTETTNAIRALRSAGASRIAVASYFLAPGLLYDRVRADALAARVPIAAPLTTPDSEPPAELVQLVLERYAQAAGMRPAPSLPATAAAVAAA